MKKILTLLTLILAFWACDKEAGMQPKVYPYVLTQKVTEISKYGARFNAELVDPGTEAIVDFGFIWYNSIERHSYSLYQHGGSLDNFTMRVEGDLLDNASFVCQSYIRTNDRMILGNEVIFTSQGAHRPRISDFYPKVVSDGAQVTITGKYFSTIPGKNIVSINDQKADVIYNSTDTLVFIVPETEFNGSYNIRLELNRQVGVSSEKIQIVGPVIESLSTLEAHAGNIITVNGKHFLAGKNIKVFFDNQPAEILDTTDISMNVVVPSLTNDYFVPRDYNIKVVSGKKTNDYPQNFTVLSSWQQRRQPPFSNFDPGFGSFTYNGEGYILNMGDNNLYAYNPQTNQWRTLTSFPGTYALCSVQPVIGDRVLVMGGDGFYEQLREVWEYNFTTGEWTRLNDLPFDFSSAVHFQLNGMVYIVTNESEVWAYNPVTDSCAQRNFFADSFVWFAYACVMNGTARVSTMGNDWQYDAQNDHWTKVSTNPLGNSNSSSSLGFQYNGTTYLECNHSLYRLDRTSQRWIPASYIPHSANNPGITNVFTADGHPYLIGKIYSGSFTMMYED